MANVSSDSIKVFPSTTRGNTQSDARLSTEYNLTSISSGLTDTPSYVIKGSSSSENGVLKFCIGGYIFELTLDVNVLAILSRLSGNYITAELSLSFSSTSQPRTQQLDGESSSASVTGDYPGISFTGATEYQAATATKLTILSKTASSYSIPRESLIRFRCDDGEL